MGPYYSGRWFDVVRRFSGGFAVVRGDVHHAVFPRGDWAVAHARTLNETRAKR